MNKRILCCVCALAFRAIEQPAVMAKKKKKPSPLHTIHNTWDRYTLQCCTNWDMSIAKWANKRQPEQCCRQRFWRRARTSARQTITTNNDVDEYQRRWKNDDDYRILFLDSLSIHSIYICLPWNLRTKAFVYRWLLHAYLILFIRNSATSLNNIYRFITWHRLKTASNHNHNHTIPVTFFCNI